MKSIGLSIAAVVLIFGQLAAQNVPQFADFSEPAESFVPRIAGDLGYLVSSPARINETSAYSLAGFAAFTAGVMFTLDNPVHRHFSSKDESAVTDLMIGPGRFYDRVDPDLITFGGSGLMIGGGYLIGNERLARTGWTALEAVFFTKLATGLIKTAAGRHRPYYSRNDNLKFDLLDLDEGSHYRSLPSGHTSRIFALSTVLASSYETPWVRIPAYTLAGSVAVERVVTGDHWVSDVVLGATLGYVMGRALARRNGLMKRSTNIVPVAHGGLVGFNIHF